VGTATAVSRNDALTIDDIRSVAAYHLRAIVE
jgi:hypothetical protein